MLSLGPDGTATFMTCGPTQAGAGGRTSPTIRHLPGEPLPPPPPPIPPRCIIRPQRRVRCGPALFFAPCEVRFGRSHATRSRPGISAMREAGRPPPPAALTPLSSTAQCTIVYRGVDGHIYDLAPSTSGTWRYRDTGCPHSAAADPRAFVVSGGAGRPDVGFVIFRGVDGGIYRLTLEMGRWTCDSIMV